MVKYKNTSITTKTFYGVEFKPGETGEVPGWINNPCMIRIDGEDSKESTKTVAKSTEKKTSESTTSKESTKQTTSTK